MWQGIVAWYRRAFLRVIAVEYCVVVTLALLMLSSERQAYGLLDTTYLTLARLSTTLASASSREPNVGAPPDIFDDQHFQGYKLKELERRFDAFVERFDTETEKIRTNTYWLFGSLIGTMASVLTSTIVYIVVSRGKRRGAGDDD